MPAWHRYQIELSCFYHWIQTRFDVQFLEVQWWIQPCVGLLNRHQGLSQLVLPRMGQWSSLVPELFKTVPWVAQKTNHASNQAKNTIKLVLQHATATQQLPVTTAQRMYFQLYHPIFHSINYSLKLKRKKQPTNLMTTDEYYFMKKSCIWRKQQCNKNWQRLMRTTAEITYEIQGLVVWSRHSFTLLKVRIF